MFRNRIEISIREKSLAGWLPLGFFLLSYRLWLVHIRHTKQTNKSK